MSTSISSKKVLVLVKSGTVEAAEALFNQLAKVNLSLIAIWGERCEELEDLLDEILVGDGSFRGSTATTTSHPGESIEDARAMVALFDSDKVGESFDEIEI